MAFPPPSRIDAHSLAGLPPPRAVPAGGKDAWALGPKPQEGATPMAARRHLPAGGQPAPLFGFALELDHQADTVVLRLSGEFDLASVGHVEAALERGIRRFTRHVVFDLSCVTFLDMAGLMSLIRADERSRGEPFDVQVVPPSGIASRVFTLTRAGERLTMVPAAPSTATG